MIPTPPPEVLHTLLIQASMAVGIIFFYVFGKMVWLRMTISGKVGCYFQEANRHMTFELIKYERAPRDNEPILTSKRDGLSYRMDTQLQGSVLYPQGAWRFMQENIPSQCFIRGQYDPVDWYNEVDSRNPAALAVMVKNAKNTAMATDVLEKVRNSMGAGVSLKNLQTMMGISILILGVGLAAVGYLSYKNYDSLKQFSETAKRIDTALSK